jgi:large subunit ribosomal protein L24e
MVVKRQCSFCANEIEPGTGTMFVKRDGSVFHFCSSSCRKQQLHLGRVGHRLKWTRAHALRRASEQSSAASRAASAAPSRKPVAKEAPAPKEEPTEKKPRDKPTGKAAEKSGEAEGAPGKTRKTRPKKAKVEQDEDATS